jgi:hypothetical protein
VENRSLQVLGPGRGLVLAPAAHTLAEVANSILDEHDGIARRDEEAFILRASKFVNQESSLTGAQNCCNRGPNRLYVPFPQRTMASVLPIAKPESMFPESYLSPSEGSPIIRTANQRVEPVRVLSPTSRVEQGDCGFGN